MPVSASNILIALLLAVGIGGTAYLRGRKDGSVGAEVAILRHNIKTTDTKYKTDTLYFARKLKVADALHDTVWKNLTDTVIVKRALDADFTAISACKAVILTCEQRVAQRDSIIAKLKPSRISIGLQGTCGYGIKGADCTIGVGGSYRIW